MKLYLNRLLIRISARVPRKLWTITQTHRLKGEIISLPLFSTMLNTLLASLRHPAEIEALLKYKFSPPNTNFNRNKKIIANNPTKKKCYDFLFLTSRSFAAVIAELDDELRDAVCLFYLILRGLDTIEDDMTLPLPRKTELLRSFHKIIYQRGWNFDESEYTLLFWVGHGVIARGFNRVTHGLLLSHVPTTSTTPTTDGPNEKDRVLLVDYQVVIDEFLALKPAFQTVIADIAHKMGDGMADYANGEHRVNTAIEKISDFDLYCHYVAGLVGYGLSDLFAVSGLESAEVANSKKISNSMGQFLQKTNIIRDYLEDLVDGRQFWPREIWANYVEDFADLSKPGFEVKAQACLSAMVLNVLEHVPDCLVYLSQLRNQSVFNFCAIPQVMAIATLALVFNNLEVYRRNVKIRKGEAVRLILASTNMGNVVAIFRYYLYDISGKNDPLDPNFMKISIAIGKIEQWIETNMPQTNVVAKPYSAAASSSHLLLLAILAGVFGVLYSRLQ
ncbi:LOW QUALITY PROTEIN: farnesyl-diphosphate farnesyltransferase [Jimgerdemannia flammicorona]|uniref:Squalene synthase n=1 Tax=Jimgerdemannia flammicorona TaxID=994334 RepID=A0A433A263_9FUNG|nr:LOW QUALITY PROTEIN: farnesyl-diphosphate farnesyltransferase [Jimgerdemannia flammicorona]